MASNASTSGPTPVPSGGVALPIPADQRQRYFDNSIWYILSLWPALTVAVQNGFGGPDSADKRDWFAGTVSTLFDESPDTDHDDLVVRLLQVMEDEFDVRVDDESEEGVAGQIIGVRKRVFGEGDGQVYNELEARWKGRGKMKIELRGEQDQEAEWSDEDEDEDEDVAMEEAPQLAPAKEERKDKAQPEIDEDGFEKVVGRKKR